MLSFLISGFDEMQGRWPRSDWYLSESISSLIDFGEESPTIYIVLKQSDGTLIDPPCFGSVPFSELRTQIRFYMACCEYAYVSRQLMYTAENSIAFRESRGASLDRQQVPKNIVLALEEVNKRTMAAMLRAQEQSGVAMGEYVPPEHTLDYVNNYSWYT